MTPVAEHTTGAGRTFGLTRARGALLGLAGVAIVVAAWESIVATGWVSAQSLPSPLAVAVQLPVVASDPLFLRGLLDTLGAWLSALGLATASAIVLGFLAGTIPALSRPLMVVVNALRSIPATALIPVAILVFGLGPSMKTAVSLYAVFPVILINTIYGVAGTEPMRIDAARSLHWPWWRRYLLLVLPSATPSIVTGIRIASGISLVVVISAELLGARSGVGLALVRYQQALHIDMAYACITIIGMLGLLLYSLMVALERATIDRIHLD
ncbi:ABC transporter permease [Microbacterium sp. SORGH_AS_0888]|uniref:ABC transporter permease n=1 Tax=Microbacterium sp. SORGH_AS_0888 TaxID=3041791 RepID=UPI002781A87D|nr:ABC transporter permease [Microbacterium sp. SORGH_AS_0888]MDQ1131274.1 NitT/TauT family transport system permease protein [Microbacterium sp. SORGH_AS_0888]